jgi:chitin disaccharide deacetylase
MATRYLIVNADDFGQSAGVNRGIVQAHERGIATSASLMVRWSAADEAAAFARTHPQLSLGLHVDLGEQRFQAGDWIPVYSVVSLRDAAAIADEVGRQLSAFRRLMGCDPSHLDSHQHVHRREPARTIIVDTARQLNIPLRECASHISYCGSFYGQTAEGDPLPEAISLDHLRHLLEALPPGCTELGCHPAAACDLDTMYDHERLDELRVLCDPSLHAAIEALGIKLCSFNDLPYQPRE